MTQHEVVCFRWLRGGVREAEEGWGSEEMAALNEGKEMTLISLYRCVESGSIHASYDKLCLNAVLPVFLSHTLPHFSVFSPLSLSLTHKHTWHTAWLTHNVVFVSRTVITEVTGQIRRSQDKPGSTEHYFSVSSRVIIMVLGHKCFNVFKCFKLLYP